MFVHVCVRARMCVCVRHGPREEVKGQFTEEGSLLSLCGSPEWHFRSSSSQGKRFTWKLGALANPSSVFGMKTSLKDLTSLRTTSVSLFPFLLIRKGLTL